MVEKAIIHCSDGFIIYDPHAENKEDRYNKFQTSNYMTLNWMSGTVEEAITDMEKLFFQKS